MRVCSLALYYTSFRSVRKRVSREASAPPRKLGLALSDSTRRLHSPGQPRGPRIEATELMAATGYDRNLVRIGKERVEGVSRRPRLWLRRWLCLPSRMS